MQMKIYSLNQKTIGARPVCLTLTTARRPKNDSRPITREIRQASGHTMRGHFGCIFKDTEEYTTGVWWSFYMRIMGT
jgi:hypothetical protein